MQKASLDTSSELFFNRFGNGIKLSSPDDNPKPGLDVLQKNHLAGLLALPFPVYFENTDHITIICNEICAEACGFLSMSDCLKETWFKPFKKQTVLNSITNDREVMEKNKFKIIEEFAIREDDFPIHTLSARMPWYNDKNKIIGLFGCSILLNQNPLAESLFLISQFGLLDQSPQHPFLIENNKINGGYFTRRELDCIRLTVRGKTAKQIAHLLGISNRTVEEYLANIKTKMGVSSKSELIDIAINYFNDDLN